MFTCEKCGDVNNTWQKFYNEYLELWRDKENWDEPKHKISCLLGFFCYLYKEATGTDYTFVPNNPNPYSSKDVRDTTKLLAAFNGDANQARKYLWWFYKRKFRPSMSIVSINYFNAAGLIRSYKLLLAKQTTLTRASPIPKDFLEWCREYTVQIFDNFELTTMNDLGAMLAYYNTYGGDPWDPLGTAIEEAERRGLIKEGKLNLGG